MNVRYLVVGGIALHREDSYRADAPPTLAADAAPRHRPAPPPWGGGWPLRGQAGLSTSTLATITMLED